MKRLFKNPLFLIFLLALVLRIYKLGIFPVGFHVDEAKVGWNALSILKTGKDDRGNKLALYYNSFGDFRPTGIFYLTIPSIAIFGRNEFAVRFPAALFGALTVFPLFLLIREIEKSKNKMSDGNWKLEITAALLLALSPWHISTSRATSEVVISLFFALWGLYFFLKGLNKKKVESLIFSLSFLIISYFFYHSIRILAPLLIGATTFFFWKEIKDSPITKAVLGLIGGLFLITLLLISNKEARGRFSQVSIFNDLDVQYELSRMPFEEGPGKVFIARMFHNKLSTYSRKLINEYTKYFSADFFLNSTTAKPARYQTVGVGLLTYVELALLIFGLVAIAQKKFSFLPLLLLLLAPLPAALTTEDAPNLHRAFLMLPFLLIIESYGFMVLWKFKKFIFTFLILNFIFFIHMYFVHNKIHLPLYRNIGAKELALKLNQLQKDYDKIILTNIPDDPYPWIAYFTRQDPKIFNKDAVTRDQGVWQTQNLVFTGQRCPSRDAFVNPEVKRLLVVDAEGCATESNLKNRTDIKLEKIFRPDGSEVYNLWSLTP